MGQVNYSIRIDEEVRERMREVPDMTDRIREFIEQEVERHEAGDTGRSPDEQFCQEVIREYGTLGAYALYQLLYHSQGDRYFLENIERRFDETEYDIEEARLVGKRVRNDWKEIPDISDEVVEDALAETGYVDEFRNYAREQTMEGTSRSADQWALWTAVQLYRHEESRRGERQSYRIEQRAFEKTLSLHGFDDDEIASAIEKLIQVGGGLRGHYNSNAYTYDYIRFPEFVIDGIEEGLDEFMRDRRTTVGDYCEEEPYLDELLAVTRKHDRYEKELDAETDVQTFVQDGAVVLRYDPRRKSAGSRSSLPSTTWAVLSPAVRTTVSDAIYKQKVE